MLHIDEHLLELYVLKSDLVEARRGEIEAHLADCKGCRTLMDEIAGFYTDLRNSEAVEPNPGTRMEKALIRRQYLEPYHEPFGAPVPYRPTTLVGKFQCFVRRHPVAAGAGSFAAMGALALLMSSGLTRFWHDKNPAFYGYNLATQAIDVYNKDHELLWDLKAASIIDVDAAERQYNFHRTAVADLDNSGRNEVLTTLSLLGANDEHGGHLRMFDGDRELRHDRQFNAEVHYRDRSYSPYFQPSSMVVADNPTSGFKEIFLIANNLGRSPSVLYRLDHDGKTMGAYWHFGSLQCTYHAAAGRLVIGGKNDSEDTTLGGYPFVAVVDPSSIVGERRSVSSPGYAMEPSDAEMYYLQLPKSDIDEAAYTSGMTSSISDEDSTTLRILVTSGYPLPKGIRNFSFEYFFDRELRPLRAKSTNDTDALHAELAKEGKVRGAIDNTYLEALKNGIRYWDGKGWRSERVMVKH